VDYQAKWHNTGMLLSFLTCVSKAVWVEGLLFDSLVNFGKFEGAGKFALYI